MSIHDDFPIINLCLWLSVIIGGALWLCWYEAGLQTRVYERQGIHMTQWEVFNGVKPAETVVQVRGRE